MDLSGSPGRRGLETPRTTKGVQRYREVTGEQVGPAVKWQCFLDLRCPRLANTVSPFQVEDFGLKFHEGGASGNVTESKYMNQLEMDILPYIEPGMMHWSLPKGMACTYENLNRTIHECVLHPEKYPSQATLCK